MVNLPMIEYLRCGQMEALSPSQCPEILPLLGKVLLDTTQPRVLVARCMPLERKQLLAHPRIKISFIWPLTWCAYIKDGAYNYGLQDNYSGTIVISKGKTFSLN